MAKYKAKIRTLLSEGLGLCFGEPLVFHCNHYNLFLQRTIEDTSEYVPVDDILVAGAANTVYAMLHRVFEKNPDIRDATARLAVAEGIYSQLGFGLLPLSDYKPQSPVIRTPVTHYSFGWHEKWGRRDKPVDYFSCGYAQAALAAAYYKPLNAFTVTQTACLTMGSDANEFTVDDRPNNLSIRPSPGSGVTIAHSKNLQNIETNVDEAAITDAVRGIPLEGNSEGLIPAFGVFLTRHLSNYYNYISYETARYIAQETGEVDLARDLFVEAGHVCAFNTFGGVMKSDEWYGLIEPQCKTREDWASGMVAVANAFGWGYWGISQLDPGKSMTMRVDGSYESNGFLASYPYSEVARSYLVTGGAAGLMNLLYHGDITEKPDLTEEYYDQLFKSEGSFLGEQTKCRSMGGEYDEVNVEIASE